MLTGTLSAFSNYRLKGWRLATWLSDSKRTLTVVALLSLVLIWTVRLWYRAVYPLEDFPRPLPVRPLPAFLPVPENQDGVGADVFVAAFLSDGLDWSYPGNGGQAIRALCDNRTWTPDLILGCEAAPGGVAEVRSAHLDCIRIAIEIGAELILPRIIRRPEDEPDQEKAETYGHVKGEPLEYFFDGDHLRAVLAASCPQLRVHNSLDDLWDVPTLLTPIQFQLSEIVAEFDGSVISHPESFATLFAAWLNRVSIPEHRRWPIRLEMAESRYSWPAATNPALARELGAALRSRPEARRLAALAMFRISDLVAMKHQSPSAIIGLDMRTTHADPKSLPSYEEQALAYFGYASRQPQKFPVLYVAGGVGDENLVEFSRAASDIQFTAVTLPDLLSSEEERRMLKDLSWDQRLQIDYEILRRASRFAGFGQSAMAWDLAVRRHFGFNHSSAELPPRPKRHRGPFQDEASTVFGTLKRQTEYRAAIWP